MAYYFILVHMFHTIYILQVYITYLQLIRPINIIINNEID